MKRLPFILACICLGPFLVMCTGCNAFRAKNSQLLVALDRAEMPAPEPPAEADDGSEQFQQALQFHRFATGDLDGQDRRNLIARCNAGDKSPFCYSIKRHQQWQRYVPTGPRSAPSAAPEPEPVPQAPVAGTAGAATGPDYSNLTQKDFVRWRQRSTDRLIEELARVPLSDLDHLKAGALVRRCPNNLAVALAATYEDHFPTSVDPKIPGELYAKASLCQRKGSSNKEHFLTRAGLLHYLAGNYPRAADLLRQVRPTDAYTGRAYYWLARSYEQMGETAKAKATYKRLWIRHAFSFHALVAALQKGKSPPELLFRGTTEPKRRSQRSRHANTLLEQMEILNRYQMPTSTTILAGWAWEKSRRLEPAVKLYLAQLGNAYFKVNRLPALFLNNQRMVGRESLRLAYPQPFRDRIEENGFGVVPELLWSIGRKESKFNPHATSHANAKGLLQINPTTAEKLTGRENVDLYNPAINIPISAFYVNKLLRRYEGDLRWVLAAYNAGELAADSWIRRFPVDDPILQIDLITYRETRTYVGFVLANYYWYRWLEGKPDSLDFLRPLSLARAPRSESGPNPTTSPTPTLEPVPLEILPSEPLLPPEP